MKNISLLALGGNQDSSIGSAKETLEYALEALAEIGVFSLKLSKIYKTPAFPTGSGPDYVNAAVLVESEFAAVELLENLHEIEAKCGRARDARWGARTMDIDLLAYGEMVLPDRATYAKWRDLPLEDQMRLAPQELILPHPRLQDRAFVLVPLNDVAPEWIHPVSGQSVAQMLENLPKSDRDQVVPL